MYKQTVKILYHSLKITYFKIQSIKLFLFQAI